MRWGEAAGKIESETQGGQSRKRKEERLFLGSSSGDLTSRESDKSSLLKGTSGSFQLLFCFPTSLCCCNAKRNETSWNQSNATETVGQLSTLESGLMTS